MPPAPPPPAGLGRPRPLCLSFPPIMSHDATWCRSPPHPDAERTCKAWGGGLLGAPASQANGEEVCIQGHNAAQARASLLSLAPLSLPGGGRGGGGAVTISGLHSWLVTEASCSWLLSQKGSCVHSSCDSTRRLPESTLGPRTKLWQSALPRESLPGPPSSATHYSVLGGWGVGEGRLWHSASLLSHGGVDWKTCGPSPLTVISSGTFLLHH